MKINSRSLVISGFAIAIAVGLGLYFFTSSKSTGESYLEHKVARGKINVSILATGTVQPENRLDIKPPIAGRAEKVLVEEGQHVKRGQVLAWMSSSERAAMLDAAQSQGPDEVKRWEELYKPTAVLAPINGMIIQRNIESGQTFANTDAILVMSDRLTVKGQVDETDIAKIKVGQTAEITLDAYPDQKIPAKVDQIAFDAKTVNNVTTYVVDVLPDVTPAFMRSGMTANLVFAVASRENVILVPTKALKLANGVNSVLSKGPNDQPTPHDLELGVSDGRMTEVLSGLNEGDTILIPQLKSGKNVGSSPFSPMGNRAPRK